MSIARFAVSRPVSVTMLACAIVVLGIFAYPRLPVDLLPSFQPPVVSVTINYGNVSPETMESTVTRPIENAVARVPGIDILQSDSFQGQTVVRAQFKYGTDINVAAVDIQEQVARIQNQLPNDPNLQPPQIVKADPNSLPVARMVITDPTRTQRELADLFTNQLSDEFSSVAGVGSVNTGGGPQRAIMVEPNQALLAANNLTTNDIIRKIAAENVDDPAGIIAIGPKEFGIRTSALYKSAQEVADTVIAIRNSAPVYVRDVAQVSDSIEEVRAFARLDGKPAVSVIVTAQPDANVVAVSKGVQAKIAELQRRYPSMHFEILFEQQGFILDAIAALEHTALYGAVLAILVILLFLHAWRSTLIVAVSLPVSVLGTLFAAYAFHQSLNTMTLGGLALAVGLIVDDAVVVIENIFRHLDEGETSRQAAEKGTAQIFSAVLSSSVTVVTVFVPLLLIPGLQGLIFGPFALVIMSAVSISFVVAVTTVPMLASISLHREHDSGPRNAYGRFVQRFDRAYARFENWYRGLLSWSLDHPLQIIGIGASALVLALVAMRLGFVQTEVFPAADSRFARFDVRMPNGTALAVTDHASALLEDVLLHDPRVLAVGAGVGSASGGSFGRSVQNQSSLSVLLRRDVSGPAATAFVNEWQVRFGGARRRAAGTPARSSRTPLPPEQRARIRAAQGALRGAEVRGRTVDIIQQTVAQGSDALQIQIFGPDYAELFKLSQQVIPQLAQIPGIVRPDTNVTPTQPEVDIKIDRRKAAQFGFSTGDIAFQIATATSGTIASYFQINGVQYPILVQFPASERRSFSTIAGLQLIPPAAGTGVSTGTAGGIASATTGANGSPGAGGAIVSNGSTSGSSSLSSTTLPLSAVASITTGVGPSQISRQNKQRRIDINATVLGVPLGAVVAQSQKIMDSFTLPPGYRWQFGPAITQNNDTFSALTLVVVLAIALIYMLLASQFESFLDPLIIMMTVPLAVVGIVASLLITHRAFGLTAFIGSLMLVGIAVKNAILVVEFTKQLRRSGMSAREALMHAGPRRLRPILMTTLATVGGMLPLALAIEVGSSTQAPLGTVVIGGLITSTALSLLVVPTLYLLVATHIEPRFSRKPPKIFRPPAEPPPAEPPALELEPERAYR
jgi:hydrophobic/amphiphilic exporter-1 (mainly G- bacteria), HAE1 family